MPKNPDLFTAKKVDIRYIKPLLPFVCSKSSQNPSGSSFPLLWAAVARLRIAYFLTALFNVLNDLSTKPEFDSIDKWQTMFSLDTKVTHTSSTTSTATHGTISDRHEFWKHVILRANALLYGDDQIQKTWLEAEIPLPNNDEISATLRRIMSPSVHQFVSSRFSYRLQTSGPRYPFVFMIDEAAYLYSTDYMRAFMWVLDQVLVPILDDVRTSHGLNDPSDQIFILMLGSHSQITHFAPVEHYPSERYFAGEQILPSIFLNFAWDSPSPYHLPIGRTVEASNSFRHLIQFGRPMWLSYVEGLERRYSRESPTAAADVREALLIQTCIQYAILKLAPLAGGKRSLHDEEVEERNSAFAVLAVRLHLDIDLGHPKRASELVASKMRWLVNVSHLRQRIRTTYLSEPVLAEAAACLLNGWFKGSHQRYPDETPITRYLKYLRDELN
jgi:hypothetical protein